MADFGRELLACAVDGASGGGHDPLRHVADLPPRQGRRHAWPQWAGIERYRAGTGMDSAPVEDAVRMVTAVIRSERFGDGSIEGALRDGTLQAAVRRTLTWAAG